MRRVLKAAALVALLAAAAAAATEQINRTVESHTFDHKTTARKRFDLRAPGGGGRVRLHVRATVREGELKFVVRDAEGRVRQDVRLQPSKSRPNGYDVDSGEMKSAAGVWTVEVELTDAVGSYEFTWTAGLGG
jgi:opacity protein-like surface antigen